MKEAKRMRIDGQICKQAQLMRKGGASQSEVAQLLGVNACTISRIEAAGFDLKTYEENRKERRAKENRRAEEPQEVTAEEQVPGQIRMVFGKTETPEAPAMSDQTKMMRFLAGRLDVIEKSQAVGVDIISMKLDKLNDTMSMVLRAIRKE